jgi:hypothetical protein
VWDVCANVCQNVCVQMGGVWGSGRGGCGWGTHGVG